MKNLLTSRDLAINGAPPAFSEPLHVGRPSINDPHAFLAHVNEIIDARWLTNNGPKVQLFEERIAEYLGVKHCVAMCNATIALEIAIRASGLSGEVIVPSWTFVATAHALYWQGITPVFADIDPNTHNLDPVAVRRMITPRTTGIIGVHLWGRAAPVEELQSLADEHGLKLLFDAAHAFGSSHNQKSIGQFGVCEVFSFHATKAFSTMEGGAIATNDDEIADAARLMRNFGFKGYDNVVHPGTNGKMIEMCAAMGLANLSAFEDCKKANREIYLEYERGLTDIPGVSILEYCSSERNSHHYIVLEIGDEFAVTRDSVVSALQAENILARKYFWPGCHGMQPYRDLFPHAALLLPNTCQVANKVVVLPNDVRAIQTVLQLLRVLAH